MLCVVRVVDAVTVTSLGKALSTRSTKRGTRPPSSSGHFDMAPAIEQEARHGPAIHH
jgi:hypothetical protein